MELLGVIDVEATCVEPRRPDFQQEIIEWPCVVLDLRTGAVIDTYHSYIRPVVNPVLSSFCTELTGISQATVDSARPLPEVLDEFVHWLDDKGYRAGRLEFATDGPWDLNHFLAVECRAKSIALPTRFSRWVNIRWAFSEFYMCERCNVARMLARLGLSFAGREHSGICDARNVAAIAARMAADGCRFVLNDGVDPQHAVQWSAPIAAAPKPGDWTCPQCGYSVFAWRLACARCACAKPAENSGDTTAAATQQQQQQQQYQPRPGDWTCPECNYNVFASRGMYCRCGFRKPSSSPSPSPPFAQPRHEAGAPPHCTTTPTATAAASPARPMLPGDWYCPSC